MSSRQVTPPSPARPPDLVEPAVPDTVLVEEFQGGRREAFEELMRRHMASINNLGVRKCPRGSDGRDLVQNTFLAAYRHLDGFRGESSFRTWLFRIATTSCLRMRRDGEVGTPREIPLDLGEEGGLGDRLRAPESEMPDTALHREELRAAVEQALRRVPPPLRLTFILREQEELSTEETASVLGITPGAVKTRLSRARSILAGEMRRHIQEDRHGR